MCRWSGRKSQSLRSRGPSSIGWGRSSNAPSRSGIRPSVVDGRNKQKRETAIMKKLMMGIAAGALALASTSAIAADALTLQTKWVTQAQFAGYFVAKDKGF